MAIITMQYMYTTSENINTVLILKDASPAALIVQMYNFQSDM